MGDITKVNDTTTVAITGVNSTGVPTNAVNADSNGNLFVKDYSNGSVTPGTAASVSSLAGGQYNSAGVTLTTAQQAALQLDSNGRLLTNVAVNAPPSNIIATGTLTGTGQSVNLTLQGTASVNIDVSGSGFVGTLVVIENTPSQSRILGVFNANSSPIASSITANGNYRVVGLATSSTITVQFSSYTSGSATINIYGSTAPFIMMPYSANAANVLVTSYLNDGSGNALTSTANALNVSAVQSGTWNINNISGTVSLPTGASTSANQVTMNSNLSTIVSNTTGLAQGSTTSGQVGELTLGAVTSSAPSYTNGQTNPLSLTTVGALRVDTKSVRTFSTPATATVNTTSTLILAANSNRKGLYLSNTSPQQISLGFDGQTPAYQYGITLFPGEKFWMDEYSFSVGAVYAITTGATTYIGVQEIT